MSALAKDSEVCLTTGLQTDSKEGLSGFGALTVCAKDDVPHHYLIFERAVGCDSDHRQSLLVLEGLCRDSEMNGSTFHVVKDVN